MIPIDADAMLNTRLVNQRQLSQMAYTGALNDGVGGMATNAGNVELTALGVTEKAASWLDICARIATA